MPFDLSTAKPVTGGFDLSTAKPVTENDDVAQARAYIDGERAKRGEAAYKAGQKDVNDLVGGAAMGVSDVGNTALNAATYLPGKLSPELAQWNRTRNADFDAITEQHKDSGAFKGGRLAGNIAATLPVGGTLAAGLRAVAPGATGLANALTTSGMRAGSTPGAVNMLTRMAGGGITGAASAGLVNPDDAATGGLIGAALPSALAGAGKLGGMAGRAAFGPGVSPELQAQVAAARQAGYVMPPSQANPTLMNRALEGFAGKLTTAQNASARNQGVTNELAKKAIGASELSPAGLQKVRKQANAAYDALGQSGAFQANPAFTAALDQAGATTAAMRQNFPELVNSHVDELIAGLKSRPQFEAQPTIEAIKQFRANASLMRRSDDPAKVAMGKAQSQIAGALEDMIDRNLQQTGDTGLLDTFREARQVLAKTHDVEKALNPATGNVDALKLSQTLKKGRPMTGDLRTIADFASTFPKAAQPVERMGSLPGISPLDFGALGTMSALTSNPLLMAGVAARPAARALSLSGAVQNRLLPGSPGYLERLLQDQRAQQALYKSAPMLLGSD